MAEKRPIYERAMAKVAIQSNGCWAFMGSRDRNGYGRVSTSEGRAPARAHRVIYEHHKGPIPDSLGLLHSCDNPSCCNPDHLSPGTQRKNMRDASKRGRLNPISAMNLHPGAPTFRGAGPTSIGEKNG